MEIVMGPRRSGKTTIIEERIRESLLGPGAMPYVVVASTAQGERWFKMGVPHHQIVLPSQLQKLRYAFAELREIYVDDLDLVIAQLISEPITCASMTISGPVTMLPGLP